MEKNKLKKNGSINILEIIFVISFMVLVGIVVYYLINGIIYKTNEVKYEGYYSKDQINAIMLATDNAINKIYNILVIATVFFTILVASITIFQYIKIRDVDKLRDELKNEILNEKKLLDEKIFAFQNSIDTFEKEYNVRYSSIEEKSDKQLDKVDEMMNMLIRKVNRLSITSAELEIDTNFVKVQELKKRESVPVLDLIKTYEEIRQLVDKYPSIKSEEFVSKIYIDLVSSHLLLGKMEGNYNYLKSTLDKAIELADNAITESCAYKMFVRLEETYSDDVENKIKYLEEIYKENRFDYQYTLRLADAFDFRNEYDDINKAIYYIEDSIAYGENLAVEYCSMMIENGCYRNIMTSKKYKDKIKNLLGENT